MRVTVSGPSHVLTTTATHECMSTGLWGRCWAWALQGPLTRCGVAGPRPARARPPEAATMHGKVHMTSGGARRRPCGTRRGCTQHPFGARELTPGRGRWARGHGGLTVAKANNNSVINLSIARETGTFA